MMPRSGTGGAGAQRHGRHRARCHTGAVGWGRPPAGGLGAGQLQRVLEVAQAIAAAFDVEVRLDIREEHLNRAGSVHGGVLATLIDAAGGLSGNYNGGSEPPLPATSLTLVTSFLGSVRAGPIRAVGVRRGGGSRIFFASVDIFSEGGELLATGQGSYRLSASGVTASGPRQGDPIEEASKAEGSR